MTPDEYAFGSFAADIATVARQYDLNLNDLEVELFTPGRQAIVVENFGGRRFRVHLSLEENRIVAVKQISPGPFESSGDDQFAKYRRFMK